MSTRIFIVEDHPVMREGYASLISHEPDLEVCGESATAEDAFSRIPALHPDIVVADLSLPGVNGIELIKRLVAFDACGAVLVVSAHDESLYAERALAAGARGYLMKHESAGNVVDAIRRVLAGHLYLSEKLRERLILSRLTQAPASASAVDPLTDREIEVFEHFGRGRTTQEIADRLGLSPKTVESHRANIKKKMGIEHAPEFVQRAVLWVERSLTGSTPQL
ncbi:MAG TPA: response regulator transcription factor [Rubricoccaceae bacterium]|jgi:DNA-binding NarL/FixJ family response regulator